MRKEMIDGLLQYQDSISKVFYQVVDQGDREGNYLEASGSSLVSYAILKGTHLDVLPKKYEKNGEIIFNGVEIPI